MKLSFKGKSAVITGACGGMGIECVKKLNIAGLKVLMLDLKSPPANFIKKYKKVEFRKIDVTNFDELKKIINKFYRKNKSMGKTRSFLFERSYDLHSFVCAE